MARLKDLIKISDKPSAAGVQVGQRWVVFLVPINKWPEPYKSRWFRTLRMLTALDRRFVSSRKESLAADEWENEKICLCHMTQGCPYKDSSDDINPECTRYVFGICVEATQQANKTPLKLDTVGYLLGVSKQRIDQVYRMAVRKMIQQIQKDPVLLEYCESLGVGGENSE